MGSELENPVIINKFREQLVSEMTSNSHLYDECDLESVRTNDWTVKRFLVNTKGDLEKSLVAAKDVMAWRKSYGVNKRTDLDFPKELFKIGAVFCYAEDKEGRPTFYLRVKLNKHFPKFAEILKEFVVHIINKIDIQSQEKGFSSVWDITGAGPSNWDLSLIRFLIATFFEYFPGGLRALYCYNVPWIMDPFLKIALKLIPEELRKVVKHISKDQLVEHIDPANLPDFIGGQCDRDYRVIPEGVRDGMDMAEQMGLTKQEVQNIIKHYDKYLK